MRRLDSGNDNARGQAGEVGKLNNTVPKLSGIDASAVNSLGQIGDPEAA